jgi:hypothetical protein
MTFIRWAACALLLASAACSEDEPPPARAPDAAAPAPPPPTVAAVPDAAAEPELKIVAGEATIVVEAPDAGAAPIAAVVPKKPHPVARPPVGRPPTGRETNALAAIRAHHGEVEGCYAPVALKDPSIAGRIVLSWTLGRDGMPTAVSVTQNTVRDPSVAACIRDRARKWRFPPPAGGIGVVTYPFDLRVQ